MKFNWIELKNFKSYGDNTTRLDLDNENTTLLIGENGMGKTTFVDAIIWCLYGKSLSNVDDIINRTTKKDCKVEINFTIRNIQYSILRFRNHSLHGNGLLFFQNGKDISRSKIIETQYMIDETIGISYNAMVSSIIYSSELYTSFLRAKPSDRLKIFESVLSLKEIKEYSDAVKKLLKPIHEKIEEFNLHKTVATAKISSLEDEIQEYKESVKKTLVGLKIKKDRLEEEKRSIDFTIQSFRDINVDDELKKIDEYEEAIRFNAELSSESKILLEQMHDIQPLTIMLLDKKEKLSDIKNISLDTELQKIKLYEAAKNENLVVELKKKELHQKLINVDDIQVRIDKINEVLQLLEKEKEKIIQDKNICPVCGQAIDAELTEKLIAEKTEKIEILSDKQQEELRKLQEAKENNSNVQKEIDNAGYISIPENSHYSEEELRSIEKEINHLNLSIAALENDIKIKDTENNAIKEKIQVIAEKAKEIPEKSSFSRSELEKMGETLSTARENIQSIDDQLAEISQRVKTAYDKDSVKRIEGKIQEFVKEVKEIEKEEKTVLLDEKHYLFLNELFSNKSYGIKKYIIDRVMGTFNENVNFFLPFFFQDNVEITFDKDLAETILLDEKEVPFSTFSSGEKTRLELSISFALFMLVKTFFSTETNLLIFDEILDMNLDEQGINSVLDIVDNLAKDNSIFVISHRDEYKEYFTNQLIVSKNSKGFSEITQR